MGIFMPSGLKFIKLTISIIHYILMQFNIKFEIPKVWYESIMCVTLRLYMLKRLAWRWTICSWNTLSESKVINVCGCADRMFIVFVYLNSVFNTTWVLFQYLTTYMVWALSPASEHQWQVCWWFLDIYHPYHLASTPVVHGI